jgi:hypothetical protein
MQESIIRSYSQRCLVASSSDVQQQFQGSIARRIMPSVRLTALWNGMMEISLCKGRISSKAFRPAPSGWRV